MRNAANWIQWTVIFLILGSAAWFVYPEIDPFESSGEVPPYMHLKQSVFKAETNLWKTNPASPNHKGRSS
jgi:hypothetical protein